MRLFTGLSLPPATSASLLRALEGWTTYKNLAQTPEEKLHVTTKFIGEWPDSRLAELQVALAGVRGSGPIEIHLRGLIWIGEALCASVEITSALLDLARASDAAATSLGGPKETRAYRPHVTVGRLFSLHRSAKGTPPDLRNAPPLDLAPFRADAFHLYLSRSGSYTRLSTIPLP
jgi:RNA 2',3'-cyclic 3'-phosphodiesterase